MVISRNSLTHELQGHLDLPVDNEQLNNILHKALNNLFEWWMCLTQRNRRTSDLTRFSSDYTRIASKCKVGWKLELEIKVFRHISRQLGQALDRLESHNQCKKGRIFGVEFARVCFNLRSRIASLG